jgi:hypothetical protein
MNASQKFDERLSSKGTHVATLLAGVLNRCDNGNKRPLMKKFLAFVFLLALALTGGVATMNALISPPTAHDSDC